ncbi:MAG: hypothetical protein WCC11_11300 [Gammaproteobacteria bacterium]
MQKAFINNSKSMGLPDRWKCLLAGVLFYVVADGGFFSSLDAWVYVAIIAIFMPRLSVCLLVVVGAVQDAPGLANQWWYFAFATVGLSTIVQYIATSRHSKVMRWTDQRFMRCVLFAVCVMLYGFLISLIQNYLGGYMQSPDRPPVLIAGLACFMIVVALVSLRLLDRNSEVRKGFQYVLMLAVFHGIIVLILQAAVSSTLFHSSMGVQNISAAAQLTEKTAFGIPRLTGTYLTPNGFGLYMAFLLVMSIYLGTENGRRNTWMVWGFILLGTLFSVAVMSKDVALCFMGCAILLLAWRYGWWRTIALIILAGVAVIIAIDVRSGSDLASIASAFRIQSVASAHGSYRIQAWNYVISNFTLTDWLVGTGLASWPTMFQHALGFRLADPHTWVLSVPGSFGFIGLLFYAYLGMRLLLSGFAGSARVRFLAFVLLYVIFIIDLFEIMLPLGNTPVTYVLWLLIGLCLNCKRTSTRERVAISSLRQMEIGAR